MGTAAEETDIVTKAADVWCRDVDLKSDESRRTVSQYRTSVLRKLLFIVICVTVAFTVAGFSLGIGQVHIGFAECYGYVWDHLAGHSSGGLYDYIVVNDRLPRIATALVTGAALAVAGCVMQSILKNPLADPYTTGISSGAGFGATLAMTAGISIVSGTYATVVNAFVFSLIPMFIIVSVAKMKGASPTVMIMAGIAVMFIFNAVSTVFKLMADPDDLAALYEWQVGTVGDTDWSEVTVMAAVTIPCCILVQLFARKINVLSTGDDSAKAMGIDVSNLRTGLLVLVSLMVASVVAFTGLIGFVGLVAPHICRIFVGADNRYLVSSSAMFGAMLLVVSDLVGRTIISPAVLEVGVVTAFIGGPMFLYLILKQKKGASL